MPHIRRARPHDAPAIAHVHVDSWQAAYLGIVPAAHLNSLSVPERTSTWRRILAGRASGTWVVVAEERLVGFASGGPSRDPDAGVGKVGEVFALYLLPSQWGRGLGFELMQSVLEDLREQRYRMVTLWVLAQNARARRFYEQCGMTLDGGDKEEAVGGAVLSEVRYRISI